ncbi:hypothetical protein LMH87_005842 [Akanthomyces muscarius]|uniref:ubiquitinyl hydrolase 1 n=1 Tax=Akanthomyces muscarius TaxID=2231603 RepID=A0A9W8QPQ3_AKAMU|nr:hypothetical protein LMH87_005842 [Akanthomyces muscarius]KAJ4164157.1 hypothetical protein LMH87_005842 [Akanthomyces muscarius]
MQLLLRDTSLTSPPPSGRRRSKRLARPGIVVQIRRKKPDGKTASRKMSPSDLASSEKRRNPKRKAAAPPQSHVLPDNLLEEAMRPLTSEEIEEWDGWIELESEPAFFTMILKDLGIFYQNPWEVTGPVWFANQTTSNACATVALLNIVMNHTDINLGSELETFKEATAEMSTAVRGYELGRNKFIRKTHNSFARRMDCLNADLFLESEASDTKTRKRAQASRNTSRKKKPKKRHSNDYGYHFVAYVPSGGFVWELDGLRGKPRKLGRIDGDCWTNIARPQIEARMLQYEESQLSFNLLSLCQSTFQKYKKAVRVALATVHFLDARMKTQHGDTYSKLVTDGDIQLDTNDALLLAEYDLKPEDVIGELATVSLKSRVVEVNLSASEGASLRRQFVIEARAAMGEYRGETMVAMADEGRVTARKKDYGTVLHKWISKLAEKGVLEDIVKLSA